MPVRKWKIVLRIAYNLSPTFFPDSKPNNLQLILALFLLPGDFAVLNCHHALFYFVD